MDYKYDSYEIFGLVVWLACLTGFGWFWKTVNFEKFHISDAKSQANYNEQAANDQDIDSIVHRNFEFFCSYFQVWLQQI